ncbi:MAG: DUF3597 domain-containing protein [Akkermansiaceae bacterium]|nr:DUF3597 domain-containing protein [Akkermansiaceae bacterium]
MGLFSGIISKIYAHPVAAAAAAEPQAVTPQAEATNIPVSTSTPTAPAAPVVDIAAVLDDLAKKSKEKLDWRKSIVDLMKLVGMDSSLSERKELARDLDYTGDMSDSAAMNIWLHKEVLKKLATNGGKVPADLLV